MSWKKEEKMIIKFKDDLLKLTSKQLFRKYILSGPSYILNDNKLYCLKEEISDFFKIEFNDIVLVGSAKLGFSIKHNKRFEIFGENSDIDIAIVSTKLFQKIWEEIYLYKKSKIFWPKEESFNKYLVYGWIRPDLLPNSEYYQFSKEWWKFFNNLSQKKEYDYYKVRGGLYHSWFFLQEYQIICLDQCIEEIKNEYISNKS